MPLATKLIHLALIKKKVSKKSKRRKRRKRSVFQRQFHSIVVNVESILLFRNSATLYFLFAKFVLQPFLPLYYTILSTFVRPCLIRGRPFPTSAIPLPQISPTTILSRHVLTPMRIRENLSLHSLLPSSHRAISSS